MGTGGTYLRSIPGAVQAVGNAVLIGGSAVTLALAGFAWWRFGVAWAVVVVLLVVIAVTVLTGLRLASRMDKAEQSRDGLTTEAARLRMELDAASQRPPSYNTAVKFGDGLDTSDVSIGEAAANEHGAIARDIYIGSVKPARSADSPQPADQPIHQTSDPDALLSPPESPGPRPREPQIGEALTPDLFPGSGFVAGQTITEAELNAYAESVGWTCRFREHRGDPDRGIPHTIDLVY